MSKHTEIGTNGEIQAAIFLKKNNYHIVATNWRSGKKEVDIIAESDKEIIFIEVKTRSNFDYGFPEEAVTDQKKTLLKLAAEAYFEEFNCTKSIRFDIISILLSGNKVKEIIHLEDAFY